MDEEEDDFYDPVDAVPPTQPQIHTQNGAAGQPQDSNYMDEDGVEEEEEEDDVRALLTQLCLALLLMQFPG
jgi:pre-mRNA 3'-end-processing factor FIP1